MSPAIMSEIEGESTGAAKSNFTWGNYGLALIRHNVGFLGDVQVFDCSYNY